MNATLPAEQVEQDDQPKLPELILEIKNFQSIPHAVLNLQGFVAIQGPTDAGKSGVVRALRSLLFNEWDASYLRDNTPECELSMTFPESLSPHVAKVTLYKSDKRNEYKVELRDGETKAYPKIGRDTPPELKQMGFSPVTTPRDDSFNLNVQPQLKPLFLVTETGTTLTSFFNTMFDIDKYEKANKSINADKQNIERKMNLHLDQATVKQETHKVKKNALGLIDAELQGLESQLSEYEARRAQVVTLVNLSNALNSVAADISSQQAKIESYRSAYGLVVQIGKKAQALTSIVQATEALTSKQAAIITVSHTLDLVRTGEGTIGKLRSVVRDIQRTTDFGTRLWSLDSQRTSLIEFVDRSERATGAISSLSDNLRKVRATTALISDLKSTTAAIEAQTNRGSALTLAYTHVDALKGRITEAKGLRVKADQIGYIIGTLSATTSQQDAIILARSKVEQAETALTEYKQWFNIVVPSCPTCKRPWSNQHAH